MLTSSFINTRTYLDLLTTVNLSLLTFKEIQETVITLRHLTVHTDDLTIIVNLDFLLKLMATRSIIKATVYSLNFTL